MYRIFSYSHMPVGVGIVIGIIFLFTILAQENGASILVEFLITGIALLLAGIAAYWLLIKLVTGVLT